MRNPRVLMYGGFLLLGLASFFLTVTSTVKEAPKDWKMTTKEGDNLFYETRKVFKDYSKEKADKKPATRFVAKGTELKVLGFDNDDTALLVELPDGDRGWMAMTAFAHEFILLHGGKLNATKIDSTYKFKAGTRFLYKGRLKEKESFLLENEDGLFRARGGQTLVIPEIITDGHWKYSINDKRHSVRSKSWFENKVIGLDLAALEKEFGAPADMVRSVGGGVKKLRLPIFVFSKTGGWKAEYSRPVLTMEKGVVTGVEYKPWNTARPLLAYIPFGRWIMNNLPWITEKPTYDSAAQYCLYQPLVNKGRNINFLVWALVPFALLGWLTYILLTGLLPFILLMFLLQFQWPFKPLGDVAVWILFMTVAVCGSYIWLVGLLILKWGIVLALPLEAFMGYIAYMAIESTVDFRCMKCRRIDTYEFDHREWLEEYEEWRKKIDSTLIGSDHRNWDTWVQHTEKWSDGTSRSYKTDMKHHHEVTNHYRDDHYDVLYRVKPYKDWSRCIFCGNLYFQKGEKLEELDRNYTGSSNSSHTSEYIS